MPFGSLSTIDASANVFWFYVHTAPASLAVTPNLQSLLPPFMIMTTFCEGVSNLMEQRVLDALKRVRNEEVKTQLNHLFSVFADTSPHLVSVNLKGPILEVVFLKEFQGEIMDSDEFLLWSHTGGSFHA